MGQGGVGRFSSFLPRFRELVLSSACVLQQQDWAYNRSCWAESGGLFFGLRVRFGNTTQAPPLSTHHLAPVAGWGASDKPCAISPESEEPQAEMRGLFVKREI